MSLNDVIEFNTNADAVPTILIDVIQQEIVTLKPQWDYQEADLKMEVRLTTQVETLFHFKLVIFSSKTLFFCKSKFDNRYYVFKNVCTLLQILNIKICYMVKENEQGAINSWN